MRAACAWQEHHSTLHPNETAAPKQQTAYAGSDLVLYVPSAGGTPRQETFAWVTGQGAVEVEPGVFSCRPAGGGAAGGGGRGRGGEAAEYGGEDAGPPRIYVCSRTHSQLNQLLSELKRTPYRPKMTVLGSRKQHCSLVTQRF